MVIIINVYTKKESEFGYGKFIKKSFRGGGNLGDAGLDAKSALEAAKVGRHCEIADECLTRGARNVIHICDSNMNGSSEREAISRRYADNETDLDAKMTRCKEVESVTENTKSILAPMAGERICGRTEWNESGKRADGANCDRVTIAELCERKANSRQEAIVHERLVSVTSAGAGELAVNSGDEHESIVGWAFQPNSEKSIQSYPSPEFLNSLSFIKKFYPAPL